MNLSKNIVTKRIMPDGSTYAVAAGAADIARWPGGVVATTRHVANRTTSHANVTLQLMTALSA